MLTHPTLDKLHRLRLPGMARAFIAQLEQPASAALSFEKRLGFRQDEALRWGEQISPVHGRAPSVCFDRAYRRHWRIYR